MEASHRSTASPKNALAGQWKALFLCLFATVAVYIPYVGYSTQIPQMMDELGMSYSQVGWLASAAALMGGIIILFAGIVTDRWGAKNVMLLGLAICAVGQLLFSYMPNFEWLLASRLLVGIGIPLLYIAPFAMAVRWFEKSDKIAISLGIMSSCDGIGTLMALYGFAYILLAYGWRTGSAIGALIVLGMLVVTFAFLKEPPGYKDVQKEVYRKGIWKEYFSVIGKKNIFMMAAFMIGVWGSYAIAVYWVPTILIEDAGWSASLAGLLGALYPVVGIAGAISAGVVSDRIGKRKPLILLSGIGMTLSFLGLAWAQSTSSHYVLFAAMLGAAGLFSYVGMPLCYTLAADTVGAQYAATANGVLLSVGMLIGGVVYPLALGYIKDATQSYNWGFIAAAISLVVLNVVSAVIARDVRTSESATSRTVEASAGLEA